MKMEITPEKSVGDLQKQFQWDFPFLKIEFSDKGHGMGERMIKGHYFNAEYRLQDIASRNCNEIIVIQPWQKTGAVEQYLNDKFGLHAQIFRKEDDGWVETAGTDFLTLDEQNEISQNLALRKQPVDGGNGKRCCVPFSNNKKVYESKGYHTEVLNPFPYNMYRFRWLYPAGCKGSAANNQALAPLSGNRSIL